MGARSWAHQAPHPHAVAVDGHVYAVAGLPSAGMAQSFPMDLHGRALTAAPYSPLQLGSPPIASEWTAPGPGQIVGAPQLEEMAPLQGHGVVFNNGRGHEPLEPLSYELLLSTQQRQHSLHLESKDAEVAHLKACVDVLQAKEGSPAAAEYLANALQTQEEAATLMMAAKHKELELMVGLLQLREQQIEDFRQLCEAQQLELQQLKLQQSQPALAESRGPPEVPSATAEAPGGLAAAQLAPPVVVPPAAALLQAAPTALDVTAAGSEADAGAMTMSAASSPTAASASPLAPPRRGGDKNEQAQLQREVRRLRLRMEELESAVSEQHERSSGLAKALEVKAERVKALEEQVNLLQSPSSVVEDQFGARSPVSHTVFEDRSVEMPELEVREVMKQAGPWGGSVQSLNAVDTDGLEASPAFGDSRGSWPRPAGGGQQMFTPLPTGDIRGMTVNGTGNNEAYVGGAHGMQTQDLDITRPVPLQVHGYQPPQVHHHSNHVHHSHEQGQHHAHPSHGTFQGTQGGVSEASEVMWDEVASAVSQHKLPDAGQQQAPAPNSRPASGNLLNSSRALSPRHPSTQPATLDAMARRRLVGAGPEVEPRAASGGGLHAMAAAAAAYASGNHHHASFEGSAVNVPVAATSEPVSAVHASSELDFTQSISGQSQVQSFHSAVRVLEGAEGVEALGATPASMPIGMAPRSPTAASESVETSQHSQELLREMRRLRLQMSELERVAGTRGSRRTAGNAAAGSQGGGGQQGDRWPRGGDRLGASFSSVGAESSSPGEATFDYVTGEGSGTDTLVTSPGHDMQPRSQGRSSAPAPPLNLASGSAAASLGADPVASSTSDSMAASWPSMARSTGARSGHTNAQQSPEYGGWEYLPDSSGDPIDAAVAALVNRPGRYRGWRVLLCRLEQGVYLCGTRRVHIRVDEAKERIEASDDGGKTWADLESLMQGAEASQR